MGAAEEGTGSGDVHSEDCINIKCIVKPIKLHIQISQQRPTSIQKLAKSWLLLLEGEKTTKSVLILKNHQMRGSLLDTR